MVHCGPRFWSLQKPDEGVCMTEVPNQHMQSLMKSPLITLSAESREGYKHPRALKWANDMGYTTYRYAQSRKNKIRMERAAK